jgi:polysaccharide biosynthesis/export protein
MSRVRLLSITSLILAAVGGCAHPLGEYVSVDAYDQRRDDKGERYVIAANDLLSIKVWNQENMSARMRVRTDGMISVPFLHDVQAVGLEPTDLAKRLQEKLKEFIVNPVVTVMLEEPAPFEVSVVGEVVKPGVYHIDQNASVLKALAMAGGITQLAGRDRIFILRYGERKDKRDPIRIRFEYRALVLAEGAAPRFRMRSGDLIVVD